MAAISNCFENPPNSCKQIAAIFPGEGADCGGYTRAINVISKWRTDDEFIHTEISAQFSSSITRVTFLNLMAPFVAGLSGVSLVDQGAFAVT